MVGRISDNTSVKLLVLFGVNLQRFKDEVIILSNGVDLSEVLEELYFSLEVGQILSVGKSDFLEEPFNFACFHFDQILL